MRPRVPTDEVAQGIANGLQQRVRQPGGQRHAQRVTVPRRVFDRRVPRVAADLQREEAPVGIQFMDEVRAYERRVLSARSV